MRLFLSNLVTPEERFPRVRGSTSLEIAQLT